MRMRPILERIALLLATTFGSALLAACSGAPSSPDPPTPPPEPRTVAEPTPAEAPKAAHLLSECKKSPVDGGGLQLECNGFQTILARLSSKEPVHDAMLSKVESDMLAGMKASFKNGDLQPHELVVSNGKADVPITGFKVTRAEQTVMVGALMAVALDEAQVLTVTCFTKDPASAVCSRVMEQVLTDGLPEL